MDEKLPYPTKCPICRGAKLLCGLPYCPLIQDKISKFRVKHIKTDIVEGISSPEVFVGRNNYPSVNVGPLVSLGEAVPGTKSLFGKGIMDIASLRMGVVRSKHRVNVRKAIEPDKFLETTQELAIASSPAMTEVKFSKSKKFEIPKIDGFYLPMGPSGNAIKAKIIENTSIPRKVDHITSDTDAPSNTGMMELYSNGIDNDYIMRILSTGMLGTKLMRKIVPTRWAITAVDDTIGKNLIEKIKDFREIGEYEVYNGDFAGNYFYIILIPDVWSFEMVECWLKDEAWDSMNNIINDWEGYYGRKKYADKITGAYYSARLAITEHLIRRRKQAAALVYREISKEYFIPLGVWVIRETVRNAMNEKPEKFNTLDECIDHINEYVNVKNWTQKSHLIEENKTQRKLFDFR